MLIGISLLLASLSPDEVQANLFDVVGQLNTGAELITAPQERHRARTLSADCQEDPSCCE